EDTVGILHSKSGGDTYPTGNTLEEWQEMLEEVFIIVGESDSLMAHGMHAAVQDKKDFRGNMVVMGEFAPTEVATSQDIIALITKIEFVKESAKRVREVFEYRDVFGMPAKKEDFAVLDRLTAGLIDKTDEIFGFGKPEEDLSDTYKTLRNIGQTFGLHNVEPHMADLVTRIYVAAGVVLHCSVFGVMNHITSWVSDLTFSQAVSWMAQGALTFFDKILHGTASLFSSGEHSWRVFQHLNHFFDAKFLEYVFSGADAVIYMAAGYLFTVYGYRKLFSGRHQHDRLAPLSFVIAEIKSFGLFIENYVTKTVSDAWPRMQPAANSGDPEDSIIYKFAHRANRNTTVIGAVPIDDDGRENVKTSYKQVMTLKFALWKSFLFGKPRVITLGHDETYANERSITDEHVNLGIPGNVSRDQMKNDESNDLVMRFFKYSYGPLVRLMANKVIFHEMVQVMANKPKENMGHGYQVVRAMQIALMPFRKANDYSASGASTAAHSTRSSKGKKKNIPRLPNLLKSMLPTFARMNLLDRSAAEGSPGSSSADNQTSGPSDGDVSMLKNTAHPLDQLLSSPAHPFVSAQFSTIVGASQASTPPVWLPFQSDSPFSQVLPNLVDDRRTKALTNFTLAEMSPQDMFYVDEVQGQVVILPRGTDFNPFEMRSIVEGAVQTVKQSLNKEPLLIYPVAHILSKAEEGMRQTWARYDPKQKTIFIRKDFLHSNSAHSILGAIDSLTPRMGKVVLAHILRMVVSDSAESADQLLVSTARGLLSTEFLVEFLAKLQSGMGNHKVLGEQKYFQWMSSLNVDGLLKTDEGEELGGISLQPRLMKMNVRPSAPEIRQPLEDPDLEKLLRDHPEIQEIPTDHFTPIIFRIERLQPINLFPLLGRAVPEDMFQQGAEISG
ncbi:MAG: hypothetical protein KC713_05665, partial [Candidatus Omnitrophica bacterium]|nr:hypothetical protein [Candidatus Omnitrophota bacterium]